MATPPKPPAPEPSPNDVMLEDVLLALQKTFSRLSATTGQRNAEEFRDQARALIVGDVDFEFTVQVAPALSAKPAAAAAPGRRLKAAAAPAEPARPDTLRYCAEGGGFPLKLSGRIATDVRHAEAPAAPPAPEPGDTR
ncbi:hypothetical protein [Ideonella oryzae]|uniref:Uncharacterized protein n=1 Tax=Ideonella oryzae TaxID=2937441 RepID=A0ABT1BG20_9BURK|nr:hypothetical protein [Ideonella oryzae]MCO5975180.1 hypothetical protein [Ideonella oryzae]